MHRIVFLSSTGKDLRDYRQAVIDHLARLDHFLCDAQEHFGARDAGAIAFCRERVRKADIFVGLIGHYRGWEPPVDEAARSITEMEYDWASEAAKPRLVFVAPDDATLPGPTTDDPAAAERQQRFRARLMDAHIVDQDCFATPKDLAAAVVRALTNHVIGELLIAGQTGQPAAREDPFKEAADAVAQVAEDENIDPAELARRGVDVVEIETQLAERAAAHEARGSEEHRRAARYQRQIGALAFLHDTHKAIATYARAVELDPDDPKGWNELGKLQHRTGALDAAINSFERVLMLGNKECREDVEAVARGNLGLIYQTCGKLDRAEAMFLTNLQLHVELGKKERMAADYGNLALIYYKRGELDRAEATFKRALKMAEDLANKEQQAAATGNLGIIYLKRGALDRAVAMHKRALELNQELGRKEGMAIQYCNLGLIHRTRGEFDRAERMFKRDLELSEELGSKEGQARATGNLGILYQQKGDTARACAHWRTARDLFREVGMTPQLEQTEALMRDAGCPED